MGIYANLNGLIPNTTYHFRLVAINSAGTTYGLDIIFTTPPNPLPGVITGAATNVTQHSATLNGTVNPNGLTTTYHFEWGATPSYGNTTLAQFAGNGLSYIAVSANLTGLTLNTNYHYRVVAVNSAGTTYGSDMTFKASVNHLLPWLMLLLGD